MTKRERYLKALRNEAVDELIWAPNFDYWLGVNTAEGTLPEKYRGMSRNDIVRAIGGYIWNRAGAYRTVVDASVKYSSKEEDGAQIYEIDTPIGSIRQVLLPTEGAHRSRYLAEHLVKDLDSLGVLKYVVEATHYEPNYEPTKTALAETGDDGVVLSCGPPMPFIQFAKTDAGYANAFYMWTDHRKEVDSLISAYFESFLQWYRVLADGPGDVLHTGDNMDGQTISPAIFKEYAVPFYQEVKKVTAAKGKLFEGHWCGRTQSLLPITPGCGLDIVEAIVTKPMADVGISEALDMLRGEVVLQGGLPAVLVCEECCSRAEFERYLREEVRPLKGRRGFILGMADNVPPNADFARVEAVAGMVGG